MKTVLLLLATTLVIHGYGQNVLDGYFPRATELVTNYDSPFFDKSKDLRIPITHMLDSVETQSIRLWRFVPVNDSTNTPLLGMWKKLRYAATSEGTLRAYSQPPLWRKFEFDSVHIVTGYTVDTIWTEDIETGEMVVVLTERELVDKEDKVHLRIEVGRDFEYPMTTEEIKGICIEEYEIYIEDPETSEGMIIIRRDTLMEDVVMGYVLKEDWYEKDGEFKSWIIGLYPVFLRHNDSGDIRQHLYFQFYFPEIKPYPYAGNEKFIARFKPYTDYLETHHYPDSIIQYATIEYPEVIPYANELEPLLLIRLAKESLRKATPDMDLQKGKIAIDFQVPDSSGRMRCTLKKGLIEGPYSMHYPDGKLRQQGQFKKGLREGDWKSYYPNGKPMATRSYLQHMPVGNWQIWYNTGELMIACTYTAGMLTAWKRYYPGGQLMDTGPFQNGQKNGIWNYYGEDGSVHHATDYVPYKN